MKLFRSIVEAWNATERRVALVSALVGIGSAVALLTVTVTAHSTFVPVTGGIYREGVVGQPSIINPIASANPADQDLGALLFAPLATLLTNLEQSKDATVYSLKLKESLIWSDGEPLTSDDVVFTVESAQDPAAESAFAAALRGATVERVSVLQVKLTLPSPNVFFGDLLTRLPVVPRHIWGRIPVKNYHLSEFALAPVGNGPYRVKEFTKEKDGFIREYHLVPNEQFVGAAPFITDFYVRFFENSLELLDAFRLHRVSGFGFVPPFPEAHGVANDAAVDRVPLPRYYAIFMNAGANDVLADPNFRLALSSGVNRTRIASEAFRGDAEGYLPGTAHERALTGDLSGAANALAKVKNGSGTSLTLTVPDVPFLVETAEMVASDWKAVGITSVIIKRVALARFREEVLAPRAYELVLAPHSFTNPDDFYPFWHSAARGATGENFSLYANPKVDTLLERIRTTEDTAVRHSLAEDVETALARDLPAVFLVSLPYLHFHTKDLEGFPAKGLISPSDRFLSVAGWSVARVRVLE
jgi:peptide/nickel transport system substrate-binding protein